MPDFTKIIVQLRGELGEVINSWLLFRHFAALQSQHASGDPAANMRNNDLNFLIAIGAKLRAEIVARLAELASTVRKGRLNFSNASRQLKGVGLNPCQVEVDAFQAFLKEHEFEKKRNTEISHKAFTAEWHDEVGPIPVMAHTLAKGLVLAQRAMKRMDREVYGIVHARFMWRELRKRRYELLHPAAAFFMIAEHIHLPEAIRAQIILAEVAAGRFHQELMDAEVNGTKIQLYASRKWGAINLGGQLLVLPQYPLQAIVNIEGEQFKVDSAWKT